MTKRVLHPRGRRKTNLTSEKQTKTDLIHARDTWSSAAAAKPAVGAGRPAAERPRAMLVLCIRSHRPGERMWASGKPASQ